MRRLTHILLLLGMLGLPVRAAAQYYSWGADAPQRWSSLRTPEVRVVFPDTARMLARRALHYVEAVRPTVGAGFLHGPLRIPYVLHPENFNSNGLVMWLPKRVELLTTPAVDSYSMPWLKQLVAHEIRHAVQYNNLDRGWFRVASRILGQQGSVIGLLFMPVWAMEGDAVMSETAMSSFGRGLQPRFTLEYRAMGDIARDCRNVDRWFCGSYRGMVPDHYQLGYQICSYAYDRYGENVWNKVVRYSVRNPYLILANMVAFRKFYGTSERRLFRETFGSLADFWHSLPPQSDSAEPLTELDERNYTTYRWPLPLADTAVLALRSDYDRPSRFVVVDRRTGAERRVAYTGSVSTRPSIGGGRVWWTEYRRSLLFDERVRSQLCWMELDGGRPRRVRGRRQALYPVAVGDTLAAWVEYRPDGLYEVVRSGGPAGDRRIAAPAGTELHGLAWDDATRAFYVLATDDSGMWPGRVEEGGIRPLRDGAYVTLSDLRAAEGRLYFGSIASGRDEAHRIDLTTGQEYRLTTSAYGSFEPAPDGRGDVLVTTYGRHGYAIALQRGDSVADMVHFARLPRNVVNPPRRRWEAVNLDTVRFTPADSAASVARHPARRYRKGLHLIHVHSWMPAAFDPIGMIEEQNLWLNLGATLVAQNLLSSTDGYLAYGWNRREGSLVRGRFRYTGLGVQFDVGGSYGGDRGVYALSQTDPATGGSQGQPLPPPARHWSVNVNAVLPLYLQGGYHTRRLTFSAGWGYSNGLVARVRDLRFDPATGLARNLEQIGFDRGLHKLAFGIGWSDAVRMAHRDIAPRWSYTLQADYVLNPANRSFSDLVALYGQLRTPGLFACHTFAASAAWQTSLGGFRTPSGRSPLGYRATRLLPRGVDASEITSDRYTAVSLDYQLPLCYPEGGISGIIYFKRIRLNAGGDFARFRAPDGCWRRLWSWGGDLIFDINLLRQPASGTSSFRISVYRSGSGGAWVGAGVGLPF